MCTNLPQLQKRDKLVDSKGLKKSKIQGLEVFTKKSKQRRSEQEIRGGKTCRELGGEVLTRGVFHSKKETKKKNNGGRGARGIGKEEKKTLNH